MMRLVAITMLLIAAFCTLQVVESRVGKQRQLMSNDDDDGWYYEDDEDQDELVADDDEFSSSDEEDFEDENEEISEEEDSDDDDDDEEEEEDQDEQIDDEDDDDDDEEDQDEQIDEEDDEDDDDDDDGEEASPKPTHVPTWAPGTPIIDATAEAPKITEAPMATTESPMDQVSTPAPSAKATKAAALEPTKAPTDAPTKAPTPGPTTAPPTMAPVTSSPTKVSILDGTSFTAETLKAELFAQQTNDKAKATEKAAPKASSVVTGEIVRPNILEQPFKDAIASGEEHHDQPIIDIPDIPHAPEPEPIIPIIAAGAGPLTSMHTASSVCAKSQADALRQCKTLPICKYESLGFGKDLIIQEYILGGQPDCVQRCDSKFGHGLDVTHCDDDEECFNFIFGCECPSLQHTGKCKPY